ncbi:MAG TPA: glycoside hydrolase family 31 protein [Candidatus Saccharimonadales bacterium]|nr:glycoside hydrolase family 31 protein [Candidatus Saccharimonadales bacterium]
MIRNHNAIVSTSLSRVPVFLKNALGLALLLAVFHPALALSQVRANDHGLTAFSSGATLEITALRDDVLRVRQSQTRALPEDASWAVLTSARSARVPVTPEKNGFRTQRLHVKVSPDLRITVTDLAGHVIQQDAQPVRWNGDHFRIYKTKALDAHYFGLGDKPGPLDRLGQSYTMWNTDAFGWQDSTDPIYKSVPFFLEFRSGQAMGVLFDNTWRAFFDFGHELPDQYSFGAPNGPLDYYLIYGPDPKQVVQSYAWLTGPTPLPPLWSLGFHQSRYSYETETRLMEVANRLRTDHIPADALYLDIDYQVENRPFTIDEVKFPHFPEMVKKLADDHFHLVVITDLHIAQLPNQSYAPYDLGIAGDHFVKNLDGSRYVGPVWPGPSVFPEFTQQRSRAWWGTLYKNFVADGISGFWNDMNEPAVFRYPSKTMPDDVQHRIDEPGFTRRTANHLEIHNIYGMENSRATYDGVLALQPNERPFVLTRASFAGGQRYAATWTGDNSSKWSHLRQTTPQLLNLGLSGFALSGADVGGFGGSPSPELLTRWIQLAAFQPIDRDHAAKGTRDHEPWVDGPEHAAIRRKFIEERYRLMLYLYTVAEENSRNGLPIVRPLFLEFPQATNDGHPMDLDASGEFLFGPSLLVTTTPSPDELVPYEIHLPPGIWYDYWTGERLDRRAPIQARDLEQRDALLQPQPLMVTPKLDSLPVYARAGSILPLAPLTQSTSITPTGPLTLRVYLPAPAAAGSTAPAALCQGDLYLDDGHTFAFRNGAYLREHFTCRPNPDGSLTLTAGKHEGSYAAWWKTLRFEIYGWNRSKNLVPGAHRDVELQQSGPAWSAEIPDNPNGFEVTLR